MFGRIKERGMGRSGCSLSWLAVYWRRLISHAALANALLNIHLGKFRRIPRLNLALRSPRPNPPARRPRGPSPLSLPPGVCWDAPRAKHLPIPASRPRGAGEGQIKGCMPPSSFPALTSNQSHSRVVPCQAAACPQLPRIRPLGARAHHRAAPKPHHRFIRATL